MNETFHSAWERLAKDSDNLFLTPEWVETWWKHLGRKEKPFTYVERSPEGRVQTIVPLSLSRLKGIRVVRFAGHGASDEAGALTSQGTMPAALARALGSLGDRWALFSGHAMPQTENWDEELPGLVPYQHISSPVLPFETSTWEDLLASRSRNFRQQVRRRKRQLSKSHTVRFRLADESTLQRDLGTFFALHAMRWGTTSSLDLVHSRSFYRAFSSLALERGWLRLWTMELDGAPAAAWLGFRFNQVEYYYQAGRDPRYEGASIGSVMLVHTIREALEGGAREYRFLRGDEGYKSRFATGGRDLANMRMARAGPARQALKASRYVSDLREVHPLEKGTAALRRMRPL